MAHVMEREMDRQLSTQFICLQFPLESPPLVLYETILQSLEKYGIPLRWAITKIDGDQVIVEAVVLVEPS